MKRLSLFKIGLILSIVGAVWIGVVFLKGEKVFESYDLNPSQTITLDVQLQNSGVGFYRTLIPDFARDVLFIQILDSNGNILADKRIETKMAVNYFDFKYNGKYILKATNLSENSKIVEIEFGDTNSSEMKIPGISLGIGLMLIIISTFRKLQNYRTAQPEEKIL